LKTVSEIALQRYRCGLQKK